MKKILKVSLFIFLMLWGFSILALGTRPAPIPTKGVFSLTGSEKPYKTDSYTSKDVVGVVIRTHWSTVEAKDDTFDWVYIDGIVKEATANKKYATIFIGSGVVTPDWVYNNGAKYYKFQDTNPYHSTYGEYYKTPVPWDPVYLAEWDELVAAFAKRYDGNKWVHHVVLANPTPFSLEMHMPVSAPQDKMESAWQQIIDMYGKHFKHKSFTISIAAVSGDAKFTDKVLEYGLSKWGNRMWIQASWLSAHTKDAMINWVGGYSDRTTVGFQMLWGASWNATSNNRQGDLKVSIDNGLKANASFMEIYEADVLNPLYANDIKYANDSMKGK